MTKNYFEQESGRSMVEMLGVLAIIGVLSVGGISGYTTAMNKHKANEILNAAAVRAMAVSTQLQNGVTDPTLGEFDSSEKIGGATFTGVDKVGDTQFKLTFGDQPSPAVLSQMQNIAGDNVGVDGSRLLYNNDLSSGVDNTATNPDNRNTDGTCKDDFDGADCDQCKVATKVYVGGSCVDCPTGSSTSASGEKVPGYNGCKCEGDKTWDAENTQCKSSCKDTGPCTIADVEDDNICVGYYCHLGVSYDEVYEPSYAEVCTSTGGTVKSISTNAPQSVSLVSGAYRSPTKGMTYDAAWSYCKALGKTTGEAYSNVTGLYISDGTRLGTGDGNYYWVDKGTGSPSNMGTSCYAFGVYTFDGGVDSGYRYGSIYALCK